MAENRSFGALPGFASSTFSVGDGLGRGAAEMPFRGFRIALAGRALTGAEPRELEQRMAVEKFDEMLAHHAGGAQDTTSILLHCRFVTA